MTKEQIRQRLLDSGVGALREYGYPSVSVHNIMIQEIYNAFFKEMLKDSQGLGAPEVNEVIDELLNEIENS